MLIKNILEKTTPVNESQFSKFLISVKRWAHSRCMYGKNYCMPSGIAWTILCVSVCQKFPLTSGSNADVDFYLLTSFFKLFSKWEWPNPIMLQQPYETPSVLNWNPIASVNDSHHFMPILTPIDPLTGYQTNTCS
jgi:poly(A) polymerase